MQKRKFEPNGASLRAPPTIGPAALCQQLLSQFDAQRSQLDSLRVQAAALLRLVQNKCHCGLTTQALRILDPSILESQAEGPLVPAINHCLPSEVPIHSQSQQLASHPMAGPAQLIDLPDDREVAQQATDSATFPSQPINSQFSTLLSTSQANNPTPPLFGVLFDEPHPLFHSHLVPSSSAKLSATLQSRDTQKSISTATHPQPIVSSPSVRSHDAVHAEPSAKRQKLASESPSQSYASGSDEQTCTASPLAVLPSGERVVDEASEPEDALEQAEVDDVLARSARQSSTAKQCFSTNNPQGAAGHYSNALNLLLPLYHRIRSAPSYPPPPQIPADALELEVKSTADHNVDHAGDGVLAISTRGTALYRLRCLCAVALCNLATVQGKLGDTAAAAHNLAGALQHRPRWWRPHSVAAALAARQGKFREAARCYQKCLQEASRITMQAADVTKVRKRLQSMERKKDEVGGDLAAIQVKEDREAEKIPPPMKVSSLDSLFEQEEASSARSKTGIGASSDTGALRQHCSSESAEEGYEDSQAVYERRRGSASPGVPSRRGPFPARLPTPMPGREKGGQVRPQNLAEPLPLLPHVPTDGDNYSSSPPFSDPSKRSRDHTIPTSAPSSRGSATSVDTDERADWGPDLLPPALRDFPTITVEGLRDFLGSATLSAAQHLDSKKLVKETKFSEAKLRDQGMLASAKGRCFASEKDAMLGRGRRAGRQGGLAVSGAVDTGGLGRIERQLLHFRGTKVHSYSCSCDEFDTTPRGGDRTGGKRDGAMLDWTKPCKHLGALLLVLKRKQEQEEGRTLKRLGLDGQLGGDPIDGEECQTSLLRLSQRPQLWRNSERIISLQSKARSDHLEKRLGELRVADLQAMLAANGQSKTGKRAELLDRCLDGALRGALPNCPRCQEGHLYYLCGKYRCKGNFNKTTNQVEHCRFESSSMQERRLPWICNPPTLFD